MKFILSIIAILLLSFATFAQSKNGTYFRSDASGKAEIQIRENARGRAKLIFFLLKVAGTESGACTGEVKGTAVWIAPNVVQHTERSGCQITIVFSGKRLTVRNKACDRLHGETCGFEGSYKKA